MRGFVFSLAVLSVAVASAQPISINNASFENQALTSGSFFYSPTQIDGWTSTATGGADRGVWNTSAPGKDGQNIAFAYGANALAQQLTATLQPNTVYTMDYLIGRTGSSITGTVELWAGGTVANGVVTGGTLLQTQTETLNTSSMLARTLTYTSPTSGSTIGQLLTIRLAGAPASGSTYVSFDHIRLAAVPEPATLSVLALGVAALVRRRKSA
jgi:hypothetical protein